MSEERQSNIDSIFHKMELQGVDTKKPLLYGYFFYDKDKSKLDQLKDELVKNGYTLVELEMRDNQKYILHVERIEVHSRASLLIRDEQLDELSKKYSVETYDGWDVGNPNPNKPLVTSETFFIPLENKTDTELFKVAMDLYDSGAYHKAIFVFEKCLEEKYKMDTCNYALGVGYINIGEAKIGMKKMEEAILYHFEFSCSIT